MSVCDDSAKEDAADCFRKATEAMAKQDWDAAIKLMRRAVAIQPTNLLFRQTLLGCERRKQQD
jgi:hypothetical protein